MGEANNDFSDAIMFTFSFTRFSSCPCSDFTFLVLDDSGSESALIVVSEVVSLLPDFSWYPIPRNNLFKFLTLFQLL